MLNLTSLKGGGASYYSQYLESEAAKGEPKGKWHGDKEALETFGIDPTQEVTQEHLENIFAGKNALTGEGLVSNAGSDKRTAAFDLTLSAPKSVSILHATSNDEMRDAISQAQSDAVQQAFDKVAKLIGSRAGKDGVDKIDDVKTVWSEFEHSEARSIGKDIPPDMQLHTHALLSNLALCPDGKIRALDGESLYANQHLIDYHYKHALNENMKELGFTTEVTVEGRAVGFEVTGVDKTLREEFSKRREQVLDAETEAKAALAADGYHTTDTAKLRDKAAQMTRQDKNKDVTREDNMERWKQEAKELGFNQETIDEILTDEFREANRQPAELSQGEYDLLVEDHKYDPEMLAEIAKLEPYSTENTLKGLTQMDATFNESKIEAEVFKRSFGKVDIDTIQQRIDDVIDKSVWLEDSKGNKRYTTQEILDIETNVLETAKALQGSRTIEDFNKGVEATNNALKNYPTIAEEQADMVKHLVHGEDKLSLVQGRAGTGKSFSMKVCNEAWQEMGKEVHGIAPSGKAAAGLQEGSGIESSTIHKFLIDVENGKIQLNENSVIACDEAGMVDSRLVGRLVEAMPEGCELKLIGDSRQLQPVAAGALFGKLSNELGAAELKNVRRQSEDWAREATESIAQGDTDSALKAYRDNGCVHDKHKTQADAFKALVSEWNNRDQPHSENLILAGTRKEVSALNKLARQETGIEGTGVQVNTKYGNTEFAEGDRILFKKNNKDLFKGVKNGELGTITGISENSEGAPVLHIQKDGEEGTMDLDTSEYGNVTHGYALTTHASQGVTVNAASVYSGSFTSAELSYVQMSRHRDELSLHADEHSLAEDTLESKFRRSMEKENATDFKVIEREAEEAQAEGYQKATEERRQENMDSHLPDEVRAKLTTGNARITLPKEAAISSSDAKSLIKDGKVNEQVQQQQEQVQQPQLQLTV